MVRKGLFGEETFELKPEGDEGWSGGGQVMQGCQQVPRPGGEQAWHGGARDARPASPDRGWALFQHTPFPQCPLGKFQVGE